MKKNKGQETDKKCSVIAVYKRERNIKNMFNLRKLLCSVIQSCKTILKYDFMSGRLAHSY